MHPSRNLTSTVPGGATEAQQSPDNLHICTQQGSVQHLHSKELSSVLTPSHSSDPA